MVPQLSSPLAPGIASPSPAPAGKDRILREGRNQFVARGYADATMQDIADAVGLTKAAVYYHFGDKEGLFEAVFFAEMERVAAGIAAELATAAGFRAQLEGVARFLLLTGGASLGRLIADLDRYVAEERRREMMNRVPHPYAAIRPAFVHAAASGAIRQIDLDVVIPLYFGMIFGRIRSEAHGRPAPAPPEALAKAIATLTIDGIGATDREIGKGS
jgi:AcrR family transcriptional regulator